MRASTEALCRARVDLGRISGALRPVFCTGSGHNPLKLHCLGRMGRMQNQSSPTQPIETTLFGEDGEDGEDTTPYVCVCARCAPARTWMAWNILPKLPKFPNACDIGQLGELRSSPRSSPSSPKLGHSRRVGCTTPSRALPPLARPDAHPPPARALGGVLARRRPTDACALDRALHGPCAADWTARRE